MSIRSPEARDRGIVTRIPHDAAGWVPNISMPIRFSQTPIADPVAAPAVGQHTGEVLRDVLDYNEERIAALAKAGTFGEPAGAVATV